MSHPPDYPTEDLRKRAKDLLEYARTMKDPELRREVEIISESYERLADRLARREDAKDDGEGQKPDAVKGSAKRVLFLGHENNLPLSALSKRAECTPRSSAWRRMAEASPFFFGSRYFKPESIGTAWSMREQKKYSNDNLLTCDCDAQEDPVLVAKIMGLIEQHHKEKHITACPICLRNIMLSVAALAHLESVMQLFVSGEIPCLGQRLTKMFAEVAHDRMEAMVDVAVPRGDRGSTRRH
jgi:hypothetical protein